MANLEELKHLGEDLYETLNELGETVHFTLRDGSTFQCIISLENKLAKSEINAINEYAFKGIMTFPNRLSLETLRGAYFTREVYPEKTYIVLLTSENIYDKRIGELYATECNEIVDIVYYTKGEDEIGNEIDIINKVYEGIKVFSDANTKTQQITDVGSIPKSVTDVFIPAWCKVTSYYKVARKEYKTPKPMGGLPPVTVYSEQAYAIENTDYTLVNRIDDENIYGVIKMQLTKDI